MPLCIIEQINMHRFYSEEEFQTQLDEFLAEGLGYYEAYNRVLLNEMQDEEEYNELQNSRGRHRGFDDE